MAQPKSLLFPVNGHEIQVFLKKYSEKDISPKPFQSDAICEDKLLLPSHQTVSSFKSQQRELKRQQSGLGFNALFDLASKREFGKPYQVVLGELKSALAERHQKALLSGDREYRLAELEACASQGRVQAVLDLGRFHASELSSLSGGYFVEAHQLGHPDGLFLLAAVFERIRDIEQGIRALLAGAWCGNIRCSALLLDMRNDMQVFADPRCRKALEEGVAYDSLLAKYVLGYVLRHGDEGYRDEDRGCTLLKEAEMTKHFRADSGKGPSTIVEGVNRVLAGTLSHLELLIDREMLTIRQQQLHPLFIEYTKRTFASLPEHEDGFADILEKTNPMTERMARRINDWLQSGSSKPPDETKLSLMHELFAKTSDESLKGVPNA